MNRGKLLSAAVLNGWASIASMFAATHTKLAWLSLAALGWSVVCAFLAAFCVKVACR